jgi:hypothetical protein
VRSVLRLVGGVRGFRGFGLSGGGNVGEVVVAGVVGWGFRELRASGDGHELS